MAQTKHEQPAEQPWEVEVSAPTVPLTPKRPPPPAPAPPAPPAAAASAQIDPQGETLLPEPPPKAPVVITPASDRTSRAQRIRTLSRPYGQGPSNLTLAVLWTIAGLSVCAAIAYFLLTS